MITFNMKSRLLQRSSTRQRPTMLSCSLLQPQNIWPFCFLFTAATNFLKIMFIVSESTKILECCCLWCCYSYWWRCCCCWVVGGVDIAVDIAAAVAVLTVVAFDIAAFLVLLLLLPLILLLLLPLILLLLLLVLLLLLLYPVVAAYGLFPTLQAPD